MSKAWNSHQLIQLSSSLSHAFLLEADGHLGKRQPQRWQPKSKVKSLRSFLQLLLQVSQFRLQRVNRWFQIWVRRSAPTLSSQPINDAWTTDALIRLSKAKASAFFVDF